MSAYFKSLGIFLFVAAVGLAQDRGTITGTVTDPTGAAVPGATVTARNANTGLTQAARTGADGIYNLLYLPVGAYTVVAESPGFRKAEAANVQVSVNTVVRLDVQLTIGAIDQAIEVTAAAPLLETTQGTNLGKIVPTKAIQDLPLFIGGGLRSTMSFIILTPGVIGDTGNPRIGGGLLDGQSELLDGAESQSERRNDPSMNGVSVEALQEFKVQTGAYSAEFGRTSNGVVNFVTKSGTNALHGSAFLFWRNEFFNARGYTFTPTTRSVRRQTNPGGSVGGPVYIPKVFDGRNKAFFFFGYERSQYKTGRPTNLITVPIQEFRNGDLRRLVDASGRMIPLYDPIDANGNIIQDAFARPRLQCNGVLNVICPERIDATAKANMALLPPSDDPTKTFNNTRSWGGSKSQADVPSLKIDYVFSDKNRISGLISRYFSPGQGSISSIQGVPPSGWTTDVKIRYYRINHDYIIRPNLLNHLTIGLNQRNLIENPGNSNMVPEAWAQATYIKGTVTPLHPGKSTRYNTDYVTWGTHVDTDSRQRTSSLNEQVAWLKGRHNVKFGFQYLKGTYRRLDYNDAFAQVGFSSAATGNPGISGQTGSAWAAFLLGLSSGGNFRYPDDTAFFFPYYAWYVQDDFKVSSKLTLNIGLRYDLPIPKEELHHNNSNFNASLPNPAAGGILGAMEFAGAGPGRSGKPRFGETRKNGWGPRLGIAYQLMPKTVLRAGGSIYYQPTREDGNADNGIQGFGGQFSAPGNYLASGIAFRVREGFLPFAADVAKNKPPVIDPTIQLYGNPFYYFPKAGRGPYFTDWQFTIEHSVAANAVARVSYHANLGNKLLSRKQTQNQLDPKYWASYGTLLGRRLDDPQVIATGFKLPYPEYPANRQLQQALRPYPQYGGIDSNAGGQNDGHMTFHALEASFEHRFSSGLYLMASYTFCKLISNSDGEDANRGDGSGQNQYNRALDKAVGIQDTPHNLRISYVYELPAGRGKKFLSGMHPVANAILGNWRVSAIQTYVSGRAMSIGSGQNLFGAGGSARASFAYPNQPLVNPNWSSDPAVAWSVPYLNKAAFRRPNNMEYGDTPRRLDYLRGPGTVNEDVAVLKNFGGERRYVEVRASAFNAFNRHRLPGPETNMDSPNFGMITNPQGNSAREIQFGIKFYF